MKPAPFDYIRAETLAEVVSILAEHGDAARPLAGGQSLIAMLNMRLVEPAVLADLSRVADADYVRESNGAIEVGAAATQARLGRWPELSRKLPLLARALPHVGHFQTRNKGTTCGSIAHADPSSELPLCLALLDGEVELAAQRGRRTVRGREFYTGLLQTAREADELITAVRFPVARPGEGHAFVEMAGRHGDFAMIAVAARARVDAVAIGIGGGAERAEVREWPALAGDDLDDALNALAWELPLNDDVHASARYRRHLVRVLGKQAIEEARACIA